MADEIEFMSPDGNRIVGTLQCGGESTWRLAGWRKLADGSPMPGEYASHGPDEPEWQTVIINGEFVYVDETGDNWFGRHLIRTDLPHVHPETHGLSIETCRIMSHDVRLHAALAGVIGACDDLTELEKDTFGLIHAIGTLADMAKQAKASGEATKKADLQIIAEGGWREDGGVGPVLVTAAQLVEAHGHWGHHSEHRVEDWQRLTVNDEVRLGYWDWVAGQINEANEEKADG